MIIDARNSEVDLDRAAEVVIIGGGVAGITLARKLSSRFKVILLESGGHSQDTETQSLYDGESVGLNYSLSTSRLRFLGGTSNHWGGWCGRFDDSDFEPRDWVPHSGWPIRQDDLSTHYEEAADILNLGRAEFAPERLVDDPRLRPYTASSILSHRVFRFSNPITRMGEKYREELERSDAIEVLLYTNAVELRLDESGSRISGVQVGTLNGRYGSITGNTVILCCGAIENARLLLASRRQKPAGIGNDHDLVGRFFMEHPHVNIADILPRDLEWCNAQMSLRKDGDHWFGLGLTLSEKTLREQRCLNMSGHFFNRECSAGETISVSAMFDQAPNPESRITLTDEPDPLGVARVQLNWQLTELDFHSIKQAVLAIGRTLGGQGLGRARMRRWVRESESRRIGYGSHHMGTTRMAASAKEGVVDANCRVHGMDNLYIAGSSVFTTSGPINPTFTLTSLALRLADHLQA